MPFARHLLALLLTAGTVVAAEPTLLLYLPLDGSPAPAVAAGLGVPTVGALAYAAGHNGQAVRLTADLRLPAAGNWHTAAGTFAAWVRFREAGTATQSRYIACLYGGEQVEEGWHHNRFSLLAEGGRLQWSVWDQAGKLTTVQASITAWPAESWHHVAVTWAPGQLQLFVDGALAAASQAGPGPIGDVSNGLCLGRDGDTSPDYLDGSLDEVYVYDQPLPAAVIAVAAHAAPEAPGDPTGAPVTAPAGGPRDGWWHSGWPFRVAATLPAADVARGDVSVELPTSFAAAAGRLAGHAAALDVSSCRVVPAGGGAPVGATVADGRLRWRATGPIPAGQARSFQIYFRLLAYDLTVPLQARRQPALAAAEAPPGALPDYASEVLGRAWDFAIPAAQADLAGIDGWGDKPEFISEKRIADGALHLRVKQDAYFIWGTMWGPPAQVHHPIDIDLSRYHVLELRLRQSVPQAEWSTFGRVKGGDTLLTHNFTVGGTGWQTVRVDLAAEARWRGHITAFRIDPTNLVDATVDLAWIRLLAVEPATAGAVACLGWPSAPPARLTLEAPATATVGSRGELTVRVLDAAGAPVSGQPVTVALLPGSGGWLAAATTQGSDGPEPSLRRGLTDAQGRLRLGYLASPRVAAVADRLRATAEFAQVAPAEASVATTAGPATQLVVTPTRATPLAAGVTTFQLAAQVADALGNPLPLSGRTVTFTAPAGATVAPATAATGADGRAAAVLTFDPAKCWVARVGAAEPGGLRGESAAVCYTPAARDWGVTVGRNGYFVDQAGKGWLPLGGFYANWVGTVPATGEAGRGLRSFVETTDAEKTAWLKYLAGQGVTSMRFMLRAHRPGGMEPMDIGGKVNPELYAEALHYLDLARPFGIRFMLTFHEDYDKPMYVNAGYRERYCLPRWAGLNLDALPPFQRRFVRDGRLVDTAADRYTDPDALACQDQYARELAGLLRHNPQVFAYELENEQVEVPPAWVNHQCDVIRSVDPRTPICMSHGGDGLRTADPLYWRQRTSIDFYTYHLYPGSTVGDQTDYGLATDLLARYGRMAGRSFLGESVGDEWSAGAPEPIRRRVARDIIWFSLVEGNPGVYFWNNRGYEVEEFKLARRLTAGIDFASWQPRTTPFSLSTEHPLTNDGWFRTREGGEWIRRAARQSQDLLRLGADFDFTPGAPAAGAVSPRPVRPSAGFEAATWSRAGGAEGLTYVRNVAGTEVWVTQDARQSKQLVRTVAPQPLVLQLALGQGRYTVTMADLVTGEVTEKAVDGNGRLELGTSDHDFGLWWRRR